MYAPNEYHERGVRPEKTAVYVLLEMSYGTVIVDVTPDPHRVDVNMYDVG